MGEAVEDVVEFTVDAARGIGHLIPAGLLSAKEAQLANTVQTVREAQAVVTAATAENRQLIVKLVDQIERERREALAKRLLEGDVPHAPEPEPCPRAPPLRTPEQVRAANELAQFMRDEPLWYDVYEKWKLHYRVCVNGHKYLEINNVGSWACRQHALPLDERTQRHPCCDRNDAGCVRADHRVYSPPLTDEHEICGVKPLILASMTGDRPGRIAHDTFSRFDRAEHDRRSRPAVRITESTVEQPKTASVWLPDLLTLARSGENRVRLPQGGVWLWDWVSAHAPQRAQIIYLDQVSHFIYRKTKDTVTFKAALLVEDVPILFQNGRKGVPYRKHPQDRLEFTPLSQCRYHYRSSE
jgi:hypothetical protein